MNRQPLTRDRRGIVIDTITITVVCLTLAIAMGGWIFGISSVFVRDGRIEIKAVYAMNQVNSFTIFVEVKNMGSASSTLEEALLNGHKCESEQFPLTVPTGQSAVVKFNIPVSQGIQSGVITQIELRTSEGITCSTVVVLP